MIKVFIIDDALLVRVTIRKILNNCKDIKVIGEAENPVDAFEVFKKTGLPDLFILDIEMPKMDGLTFLKKIQKQRPIPTIICSNFVNEGSPEAIESLRLGACDIISKPKVGINNDIENMKNEFIKKIKSAVNSKNINKNNTNSVLKKTNKIIGIGASTGGVQTLEKIFVDLLPNHPPIVVVQHMPEGFTASFATSLNKICENSIVKEAKEGDRLSNGQILIAPGDKHIEVAHEGLFKYKIVLKDYPKVSSHKPSVDVLFKSLAKEVKQNTIAFILTGMGKDGAEGIKQIRDAKGKTYGQNEKTCVVYGMPKVAFDIGGIEKQLDLSEIATTINNIS